jgi:O-antigen/teichoic acid export membrane protein
VLSGVVSTALGLGFWALAVRLYPPEEIGRTSAAVSMMLLLAAILQLNLTNGLVLFLPEAGNRTGPLVRSAYAIAAVSSLVGAGLFTVVASGHLFFTEERGSTAAFAVLFIIAVPLWSVFVLQDSALIGLRSAGAVPIENAVFALVKIVLLVPLSVLPQLGLLGAWLLSAGLVIVPLNAYIFRRLIPTRTDAPATVESWWQVRRYLASDYLGGLLETAFVGALPVVVAWKLGLVTNAYFYTSWIVVTGLEAVLFSIGSSLTAEGARERSATAVLHHSSLKIAAALILPVVLVGFVGAPWLLGIYGHEYAVNATALFQLLLLAMPLRAIVVLRISVLRIEHRGLSIMGYQGVNAVMLLVGALFVLERFGLTGMGWVFLAVQALLASIVLASSPRRDRDESKAIV